MIRAAGSVLWRPGPAVAVVHRPRHDDWSLPKGKVHDGEPLTAAARRETVEETGVDAALTYRLGRTTYRVDDEREKRVDYWAARAGETVGDPAGDEVDAVEWLPLDAARERLSWDSDRAVLARLDPVATATVLLVRHASAGKAEAWGGHDDDRPLDPSGLLQAEALAAALPAFWLRCETPYVAAPPIVRCVDTVRWAGEVTTDERLGGSAFEVDPEASVAYVRELASYGVAVAGSQGGIVAGVVEALRRADGLAAAVAPEAKGSAWVLSFANGRLVAADYLDAA